MREVAAHHEDEANRRFKIARSRYEQAVRADASGHSNDARLWRAEGDAEFRVAASQRAEADRLRMMADIYDEMPEPPK